MIKLERPANTDSTLTKNDNGYGINRSIFGEYNRTLLFTTNGKQATATLSEPSTNFEFIEIWWYSHDGIEFGNMVFQIKPFSSITPSFWVFLPSRVQWSTYNNLRFNARRFKWNNASSISIVGDAYNNVGIGNLTTRQTDGIGAYCYFGKVWGINRK